MQTMEKSEGFLVIFIILMLKTVQIKDGAKVRECPFVFRLNVCLVLIVDYYYMKNTVYKYSALFPVKQTVN